MKVELSYQDAPPAGATAGKSISRGAATMRVERLEAESAEAHATAWQDLAHRCLEPNVFLEPGFALAAAKHLAKGAGPNFLFVWDDAKAESELIAVCPLAHQTGLGRFLPRRLWTHDQAPLGAPLIDRSRAADALSALFAYARRNAGSRRPDVSYAAARGRICPALDPICCERRPPARNLRRAYSVPSYRPAKILSIISNRRSHRAAGGNCGAPAKCSKNAAP